MLKKILIAILLVVLVAVLVIWRMVDAWKKHLLVELASKSKVIETKCGPVEYAISGEGPAVLFFHGSPAGYDEGMLHMRAVLNDGAGYRLISFSRPGFLRTPLGGGKTFAEQADLAAALLDVLGVDRVAAMGTSGGGAPLLQFALRHPDRCWALVPLSCAARKKVYSANLVEKLFMCDFTFWLLSRFPNTFDRMVLNDVEPGSHAMEDPKKRKELKDAVGCFMPPSARAAGSWNDVDQYAKLPVYPLERITAPTLVVHGTADPLVPFEDARFMAGTIPGAEHYWQEGGGHALFLNDNSDQIDSTIQDFLKKHAPKRSLYHLRGGN